MGHAMSNFSLAPSPGALRRGQKVKYHLILITKSISKIFYQTLFTKHTRRDFHSVPWVMPRGWDFGALGCEGGQNFFIKHGHVVYQIDGDDEQNRMQVKFSS